MRIIAGALGGRRIHASAGSRPTTERLRESLFSIWSGRVEGARFLDLFCGGGAVGLEAASRGAREVVFVDRDPGALDVVRRNCSDLGLDKPLVRRLSLPGALTCDDRAGLGVFDLIFSDPPYDFVELDELVAALVSRISAAGLAAVEHGRRTVLAEPAAGLELFDRRDYGGSSISFFRRR